MFSRKLKREEKNIVDIEKNRTREKFSKINDVLGKKTQQS